MTYTRFYRMITAVMLGAVLVFLPVRAFAHKVMIFGWVEDGKVKTISKFSGGKRVSGGKVLVYNDNGQLLLDGVTDENGEFDFAIPRMPGKGGLKLELEATMGHKNIGLIPADQFADAQTGSKAAPDTPEPSVAAAEKGGGEKTVKIDGDIDAMVEESVSKALDRKVMPLLHALAEKEDKPAVSDILGGIGYIVGLMGIALYMKGRKNV